MPNCVDSSNDTVSFATVSMNELLKLKGLKVKTNHPVTCSVLLGLVWRILRIVHFYPYKANSLSLVLNETLEIA